MLTVVECPCTLLLFLVLQFSLGVSQTQVYRVFGEEDKAVKMNLTLKAPVLFFFFHFLKLLFYCCAGQGYIMAFTKVLILYQIYHT
jgi:hypothetical protein